MALCCLIVATDHIDNKKLSHFYPFYSIFVLHTQFDQEELQIKYEC